MERMNKKGNEMINDRMGELLELIKSQEEKPALMELATIFLTTLMEKEREIYLKNDENNKANGYSKRKLGSLFGNMELSVPRDRKSDFRSYLLPPPWKRFDDSFNELVLKLTLNSYSPNRIKSLLNSLNLPYSYEELGSMKEELYLKAKELKAKQLASDVFALFIDAYHCEIRDDETKKVKKSVIYTIIGIDMKGMKDIYGYYVFYGNETREDWLVIFNDLINRGLKRVLLIVSDNFNGLDSAIKALFPKSEHQLCFIHMKRNLKRHLSKEDYNQFVSGLEKIRVSDDYDEAVIEFEKLCNIYKDKYPVFMKQLIEKKERYWTYLKFPSGVRKHIYTTNAIENFNSRLEVLRIENGGYFQSIKTAEVSIYVLINRLKSGKWSKPMLYFKNCEYEIIQLFNKIFFTETHFFI
jgi:transposase-like protein